MLSKNDMTLLRGMFTEMLNVALKVALKENNEIFGAQLKREIRDEMQALLRIQKGEIVGEITEFIDSALLPQISDLDRDVTMIKRHLRLA